jgi:hypothetical protein
MKIPKPDATQSYTRQGGENSIDALVIQFRVERMVGRMGWIVALVFVLGLGFILLRGQLPG